MKLAWVALVLIGYTAFAIHRVMPRLPERIPTGFNFQGYPTAWSSPETLWLLLAVQVAVTALLLAVPAIGRRAPKLVSLGRKRLSDYPPEARERILPLLEDMSGWMAVLFCLFFSLLIRDLIRAALNPGERPSLWPLLAFAAGMIGVILYYLRCIHRVGKERILSSASRPVPRG